MLALTSIVARSTAPGSSLRALIRISGPHAITVTESRCGELPRVRCCISARYSLASGPLPVFIAVMPGPGSYTGEDVVEIQVPGNQTLVERIINDLTSSESCRRAHPGEFSARGYLAGRFSLPQAEGVAAIINAENSQQLDAARTLRDGSAGAAYAALTDELLTLLALVESGIDFSDQDDVVAIGSGALRERLGRLISHVDEYGARPKHDGVSGVLPRVALVGQPNAGKSTLFNALVGHRRSVVSDVAGTTRDVIEEELDLAQARPDAGRIVLQDLAGLDQRTLGAIDKPDALAQTAASEAIAGADAVVWCDPSGRFDDSSLPELVRSTLGRLVHGRLLRVRTCADRGPSSRGDIQAISVCALDGTNLPVLRRALADMATADGARLGLAALLPRHRAALDRCRDALGRALDAASDQADPMRLARSEELAESLRSALDAAGELSGRISPDDILGRVFATFCVGK